MFDHRLLLDRRYYNASDMGPLDYQRNAYTRHIVSTSSDELVVLAHPDGNDPDRFYRWFGQQKPKFVHANNA